MKVSPRTIYRALEKPHVRQELERKQQDITQTIKGAFSNGLEKLEAIINDPHSSKSEIMKAFREVRKTMEFMALELEKQEDLRQLSDEKLQIRVNELKQKHPFTKQRKILCLIKGRFYTWCHLFSQEACYQA